MKSVLSALDLHYLIEEWKLLINAKLDKVFSNKEVFLFQFHAPGVGKKYLKIILPSLAFITEHKEEFGEIDNFCVKLRKSLSGSRLRKIEQKEFERIVEFVFEKKDEKYSLFIELFSTGNLILCDKNLKILMAYKYQNWADRTIRGGIKYIYPKKEMNFFDFDEDKFIKFLSQANKNSIVVSLAKDLGLGGNYAEELCVISEINKIKTELTSVEIKRLFEGMNELSSKKIEAVYYEKEGIFPFPMKSISDSYESLDSFNSILDDKISKILEIKYKEKKNEKFDIKKSQLKGIIRQQEAQIKGLKKAIEENQNKGDLVYHNYPMIEKIIIDLNKALKEKDIKEINKKIKGHKLIKKIDTKNKEITIDIS